MYCWRICLVLSFISTAIHASPLMCNCNESDDCDKCTPLVIRPVPLPRPITECNLNDKILSSPCTCRDIVVKPAIVPRPTIQQTWCDTHSRYNCDCSNTQNNDFLLNAPDQFAPSYGDALADPVSIAVAYQNAVRACRRKENQLAFGFRVLPQDVPIILHQANIPEERLSLINGDVVELKNIPCDNGGVTLEEEAAEDLLMNVEDVTTDDLNTVRQLSLADLGYGLVTYKRPQFTQVMGTGVTTTINDNTDNYRRNCNDGYQPGNVIIRQIGNAEPIRSLPCDVPPPCTQSECFPTNNNRNNRWNNSY